MYKVLKQRAEVMIWKPNEKEKKYERKINEQPRENRKAYERGKKGKG